METKRPLGVRIIGIFILSYAIFLLALSFVDFFVQYLPKEQKAQLFLTKRHYQVLSIDTETKLDKYFRNKAAYAIFESLLFFIISIGILRLKNWARLFAIIYFLLASLAKYYPGISGNKLKLISAFINFLIFSLLLYYLTRPKVKRAFSERNPEQAKDERSI